MRNLAFSEWVGVVSAVAGIMSIPWLNSMLHVETAMKTADVRPAEPIAVSPRPGTYPDQGPAFDCARKVTWAETTICGSDELAMLDRRLHETYSTTMMRLSARDRRRLRHAEMIWSSGMHICRTYADGISCLQRYYIQRITWLATVNPGSDMP